MNPEKVESRNEHHQKNGRKAKKAVNSFNVARERKYSRMAKAGLWRQTGAGIINF